MDTVIDPAALGSAALVATFLVPLLSLIKRPNWSNEAKQLLALAGALVAAIVGAVVDGSINNATELVAYFGTASVTAQTLYGLYFKKTALEQKLAST